jgi:hypothetical protein
MPDEPVSNPASLSRRTFLGGVAGTMLLPVLARASADRTLTPEEIAAWQTTLFDPGAAKVYRASAAPQAAFPTGGVGCGNVYVGAGGHLRDWLIFNNTHPVQVPNTFFAARVERSGREPVTRRLETETLGLQVIGQFGGTVQANTGRVAAPGTAIRDAELVGEYPSAFLRYVDPELPVEIRLEAFTPWVPQDARASAFPGTVFLFHIKNPGSKRARVSLLASLHHAAGLGQSSQRVSEGWAREGATGIRLSVPTGTLARLSPAAELLAAVPGFELPGVEKPETLTLRTLGTPSPSAPDFRLRDPAASVIWLEDPETLDAAGARALRQAVEAGATLVLSGTGAGLLERWSSARQEARAVRRDIVFDDFESGTYAKWTVEGTAFGTRPPRGTLPGQQPVSGFRGTHLVNSFTDGDAPTGRLTSVPFRVERRFVRFLIGGGAHAGRTCINLLVDGKPVRTATGRELERLEPHAWNVTDLAGKEARLEIVDADSTGWGHINIDDIVFSDLPGGVLPEAVLSDLDALLPISFGQSSFEARPFDPDFGKRPHRTAVRPRPIHRRAAPARRARPAFRRWLARRMGADRRQGPRGAGGRPAASGGHAPATGGAPGGDGAAGVRGAPAVLPRPRRPRA